ncbi:MAG: hypothetical protein RL701_7598, partial [Pseudomonadota bacterium]
MITLPRSPRPEVLALWLSGGVPFLAYVLTASGFSYWLDSGEFVAGAVYLDIAHPPGHPLSGLWGKAISLLPLGSLSFRSALGQALASAIASVLHCRATAFAVRRLELDPRIEWSLSLFGAWLSAFTYALWFQAVRPEVYALQTLCSAAICERLLALTAQPLAQHSRPLVTAAGILGLALCNHHLIALLLVPAFMPALVRALRLRHFRSLGAAFAAGTLGLGTYVYLPLRAAHALPANFGNPNSWERFAWVVSARVYAHDMGSEAVQPLATRLLDVLALWYEDLQWAPLALAAIGMYLCLRLPKLRAAGIVLTSMWVVDGGVRAWLGPVRANPDILGYLAPSYLAIGSLAACGLGVSLRLIAQHTTRLELGLRRVAWLVPLIALSLIPQASQRSSLAHFTATDDLDELRLRALPPRSVVLQTSPQAV